VWFERISIRLEILSIKDSSLLAILGRQERKKLLILSLFLQLAIKNIFWLFILFTFYYTADLNSSSHTVAYHTTQPNPV